LVNDSVSIKNIKNHNEVDIDKFKKNQKKLKRKEKKRNEKIQSTNQCFQENILTKNNPNF